MVGGVGEALEAQVVKAACDVGFEVDGGAGEGKREHHGAVKIHVELNIVEGEVEIVLRGGGN